MGTDGTQLMQQVQGPWHCIQEHCVCLPVFIELLHMMMMCTVHIFLIMYSARALNLQVACLLDIIVNSACTLPTCLLPSSIMLFLLLFLLLSWFSHCIHVVWLVHV
jgi:hypothetical protein